MILAENVLILAYDDIGMREPGLPDLSVLLSRATLLDLALSGRVAVARTRLAGPNGRAIRRGRVIVQDASPTGNPLLDRALATTAAKPRTPVSLASELSRFALGEVEAALLAREALRREHHGSAGKGSVRWLATDPALRTALRERLAATLTLGVAPTTQDAAILALIQDTRFARRLAPQACPRAAAANTTRFAVRSWAVDATRRATRRSGSNDPTSLLELIAGLWTIFT